MNILTKIRIKVQILSDYYLFQVLGVPKVKLERISKSVLKKYLPRHPVVIDCGAHDGSDSLELARILKGKIHSFEPVPSIYERLKENTSGVPNISCYQVALSNQSGSQSFYISEGDSDASSSLLEPGEHLNDHPNTVFNKKLSVKTLTLDDWAAMNNIEKIDLLWLDMQGFELMMLDASTNIFKTVKVIHTEVSTKETYKGVPLYQEYKNFLLKNGFSPVFEALPTGWDMGNVLFVRNGEK